VDDYPTPEPVPFRLKLAGEETLDTRGVRSVSYKVDGMLHLDGDNLTLEWAVDRHTESIGLGGVRTDVEKFDYEDLVVPLLWLMEVRLTRFPRRLRLRAKHLHAFEGVPGEKPGRIALKIKRRDRHLAAAMVRTINQARLHAQENTDPAIEYTDPELLTDSDTASGENTYG